MIDVDSHSLNSVDPPFTSSTPPATVLDVMTTTTNISPSRKADHNLGECEPRTAELALIMYLPADSLESLVQNKLDAASHRLEQLKCW